MSKLSKTTTSALTRKVQGNPKTRGETQEVVINFLTFIIKEIANAPCLPPFNFYWGKKKESNKAKFNMEKRGMYRTLFIIQNIEEKITESQNELG